MSKTGCPICDKEQEITGDLTNLCDIHELEYLKWMAAVALKHYTDYNDKIKEILRKGKEGKE